MGEGQNWQEEHERKHKRGIQEKVNNWGEAWKRERLGENSRGKPTRKRKKARTEENFKPRRSPK